MNWRAKKQAEKVLKKKEWLFKLINKRVLSENLLVFQSSHVRNGMKQLFSSQGKPLASDQGSAQQVIQQGRHVVYNGDSKKRPP